MTEPRRPDNDYNPGDSVTIVENHQRPAQPHPAANQDLAREHGNRVALLADIAEEQLSASEREREDRNRYEDGFQVLRWLVGAPRTERLLEIDWVLHDEHGGLSEAKIAEYIRLVLNGEPSLNARYAMVGRHVQRAKATRSAVAEAREVSANLHHLAEAVEHPQAREAQSVPRPALPSAAMPVPDSLPHRGPIAPTLPPLFPPAPEPTAAETTSHLVERVIETRRENGRPVAASEAAAAARLAKQPAAAPAMGPAPDASFAASALPGRIGDTVTMRADEVLAELAADDASADGAPEPRPFETAASTAASDSSPSDAASSESGDGDDA